MYVPRDEAFGDVKRQTVDAGSWKGMVNNFFPFLKDSSTNGEAITFSEINELYKENSCNESQQKESPKKASFPIKLNKMIKESTADAFRFDPPNIVSSKNKIIALQLRNLSLYIYLYIKNNNETGYRILKHCFNSRGCIMLLTR